VVERGVKPPRRVDDRLLLASTLRGDWSFRFRLQPDLGQAAGNRRATGAYQRLSAMTAVTTSNIKITHAKKTGGPSGIT
jgi:hypothetical protein